MTNAGYLHTHVTKPEFSWNVLSLIIVYYLKIYVCRFLLYVNNVDDVLSAAYDENARALRIPLSDLLRTHRTTEKGYDEDQYSK